MNESGSLVEQMTAVIRGNFLRLWALALWPYLAEVVAFAGVRTIVRAVILPRYGQMSPMNLWQAMGVGARCAILLVFVVQVCLPRDLALAGITMAVSAHTEKEEVTATAVIARLPRILPILLVLSIVAGWFVVGGTMLLIVPGLFFAILTAFLMPSLAAGRGGVWTAAGRSLRLSMKSFGPLLLLALAAAVASGIAMCALMIPIALAPEGPYWWMGWAVGLILFLIVLTLVVMVHSVGVAVLYLNALRGAEPYQSAKEAI